MGEIISNIAIIVIIAVIVVAIIRYLYRAKKRGEGCIGCPYGKQCSGHNCSGGHQASQIHTEK